MTAEEIKAYCLSKQKACETYPFGDVPICYKLNGRIFAQLYPDEWDYKITLKCTADAGEFYRDNGKLIQVVTNCNQLKI